MLTTRGSSSCPNAKPRLALPPSVAKPLPHVERANSQPTSSFVRSAVQSGLLDEPDAPDQLAVLLLLDRPLPEAVGEPVPSVARDRTARLCARDGKGRGRSGMPRCGAEPEAEVPHRLPVGQNARVRLDVPARRQARSRSRAVSRSGTLGDAGSLTAADRTDADRLPRPGGDL